MATTIAETIKGDLPSYPQTIRRFEVNGDF
jgi:hypothetical protein